MVFVQNNIHEILELLVEPGNTLFNLSTLYTLNVYQIIILR